MSVRFLWLGLFLAAGLSLAAALNAQEHPPDGAETPASPTAGGRTEGGWGRARGHGLFGRISMIENDSIELTGNDGKKTTVKLAGNTEFRKDRQPAKASDFKVGDMVMVRTAEASEQGTAPTALMVVGGQGFGARGGPGALAGALGKDFVVGEVKAIDPPKLTVLRPDNVTQTLELNEETSLRRGRDAVTMADIHPGDHVFIRGAVANDLFVPKNVTVISPEQWNRMQEMMTGGQRPGGPQPQAKDPAAPAPPQNPPEPEN
jgi:ribosomal protein S11